MKYQNLSGIWGMKADGLSEVAAVLPGTLDENGIGFPDVGNKRWHPDSSLGDNSELLGGDCIQTRLTRSHTYEGRAIFTRSVIVEAKGRRVFFEAERSRELTLRVNSEPVAPYTKGTASTPYVFEVTNFLRPGENEYALCCDNSYPNWPHDAILFSSAATDETQTNWNGVIGYLRLRQEAASFISAVRAYPRGDSVDVLVELDLAAPYSGILTLESAAFADSVVKQVARPAGRAVVEVNGVRVAEGAPFWDEGQGVLHELTVRGEGLEPRSIRFGLRTIANNDGRLALNGRNIFLRGEANCCVFPKTGHMPMTIEEWTEILRTYASYGVNCVRFHSHCPPDAAFTAADRMGMLMQPELSHWNPRTAFEDEKSWDYFRLELRQILLTYANHPSFVLFTLGNELQSGALGYKRMGLLMGMARELDPTRLCSNGSNNFCENPIGPDPAGGFFTAASFYKTTLRGTSSGMTGHINERYPSAKTNFDGAIRKIRGEFGGPVFGFEVGQYEVLPDFGEWDDHAGVTRPDNYLHIRDKIMERGLLPRWKRMAEATGELALICYREEIEAMLRTGESSGLSLLSLQDFPGQGTALVGMLNAHFNPKPYDFARPERFRRFFSGRVPLVLMDKYTYTNGETLAAGVKLANYGRENVREACVVRLLDGRYVLREQTLPAKDYPCGELTSAGTVSFPLGGLSVPRRLTLTVTIGEFVNDYPVWVYRDAPLAVPERVLLTGSADEAISALGEGRDALLLPEATEERFPKSIKTQFTTNFWSVGTFAGQSGFMGCLVDPEHPVFAGFPTEFHSNWQWWPMCKGRAIILPGSVKPLITALDCCARMRHMGMLLEVRVGRGRLMLGSMGLLENQRYPEVRALTQSILEYMISESFRPETEMSVEAVRELVR